MAFKTIFASTSFASAIVLAGLAATVPAHAQFNEQTIPQECLDAHGRLVLTGANMEACQQYAYVQKQE